MKRIFASVLALFALQVFGEKKPFENYRSIIDRQMFGKPPAGFDATKNPSDRSSSAMGGERELSKEEEEAKSAIRFSAINVSSAGEIAVGFVDDSVAADKKAPAYYYLKVGETGGDWTVKSADAVEKTMTLVKSSGIEITVKLGENTAPAGGKNARRENAKRPDSLRGRRAEQEEERARARKQLEEAQKRTEEERKQLEEERKRMEEERQLDRENAEKDREEQKKALLSLRDELSKVREENKHREDEEDSGDE